MKIRCRYTSWQDVPKDVFSVETISAYAVDFHISIDTQYIVYSITVHNNSIWYYICDDAFSYYPRWRPAPLFEVVDPRLSRYWIYEFKKCKGFAYVQPIIAFPEWASNHPDFYDKLSDGDEREVALFNHYKELMDLEFSDPAVTEVVEYLDGWCICSCFEAWQTKSTLDALVRCPKCKKLWKNPFYDDFYRKLS